MDCKAQEILQKVDKILEIVQCQQAPPKLANEWLSGEEVCKILKVCKRTLQTYRDEGKLEFSQFGRRILYAEPSVKAFLKKYSNPEFKLAAGHSSNQKRFLGRMTKLQDDKAI